MKNLLHIILLGLLYLPVQAQQSFDLFAAKAGLSKRKCFGRVLVIDRRSDTGKLVGKIKVDAQKGYEDLFIKGSLSDALARYYQGNCATRTEQEKMLIVVLYSFISEELREQSIKGKELARFYYSADFFVGDSSEHYRMLGSVDTEAFVSAFDVTERMLGLPTRIMNTTYKILKTGTKACDKIYTLNEVQVYDPATPLSALPFSGKLPRSGYYEEWIDFLCMRPAKGIKLEHHENNVSVYRVQKKVKKKPIRKPTAKVLIHHGKPYYNSYGTYRAMKLKDGDFWVTAPVVTPPQDQTTAIPAPALFGMLGGAVFNLKQGTNQKFYECKVNPRTGTLQPTAPAAPPDQEASLHIR